MKIGHNFNHASGVAPNDFSCVAYRYPGEQFEVGRGESWIVQVNPKRSFASQGRLTLYTGLWRSPTGKLFISDAAGKVRTGEGYGVQGKWSDRPMPRQARLQGIWGLRDDFVLTWGVTPEMKPVMFRFDGTQWHEHPTPGEVIAMHGTGPNFIYAVGHKGLNAHWDGQVWHSAAPPNGFALTSAQVVSPEEIWVTGAGGRLYQGSIHGLVEVLHWEDSPLAWAARFKGDLWVAGTEAGLLKLKGRTLEPEKANIPAERLELHKEGMLITSPTVVAFTADGKSFQGVKIDKFIELAQAAQAKPLWEIAEGEDAVGEEDA